MTRSQPCLHGIINICTLLLCMTAQSILVRPLHAEKAPDAADFQPIKEREVPSTYCGVYAAYGAINSLGSKTDFQTFLKPRYIGSSVGSSVSEVEAAIIDHGFYVDRRAGMTYADLEYSQWPVILHTSTESQPIVYNHWILFLGIENNRAKVVDASEGVHYLSPSQLLARWDSIGIVVASKSLGLANRTLTCAYLLLCSILVAAVIVFSDRYCSRLGLKQNKKILRPTLLIVCISVLISITFHYFNRIGLFSNPDEVRSIRYAHFPPSIPDVSEQSLSKIVESHSAYLIDARFSSDYHKGHISNAINIPVVSSRKSRVFLLRNIKRSDPIVLYCQSSSCPFDDILGRILIADGYTNVRVFSPGWRGWTQYQNSTSQ